MANNRLLNTIMQGMPGTPYDSKMIDLTKGGQYGFIPRIGSVDVDGVVKSEIINNTSYIRRDLVPVLLDYPRFFDFLPEPHKSTAIATLKSLIEDRPMRIEGINASLSVDTTETQIGASGESIVEPTKVKQERSNLTFVYTEVLHKTIQRFIDFMIRYGIGNQHTNVPMITHYISAADIEYSYTLDFYSFSMALIEPDPLMQFAVDGFICTNCFFQGSGDRLGSRDIASSKDKLELSLNLSPVTTSEPLTVRYCTELLQKLTLTKQMPTDIMLPPRQSIDPNLEAIFDTVGMNRGV